MIILRKSNGVGRVIGHSVSKWLSRKHGRKHNNNNNNNNNNNSKKNFSATLLNNCQQ